MPSDLDQAAGFIRNQARHGPVVLVFSDSRYSEVLGNWLRHARAAGVRNIVVCALDEIIASQMTAAGIANVSLAFAGDLKNLWKLRMSLLAVLCEEGTDFIHSDADAVWLRNPIERLMGQNVDLAFSQGTIWPHDIAAQWGFVLCCGLFAVRGSRAAGSFFEAVAARSETAKSDQAGLNHELRDAGIVWQVPAIRHPRVWQERPFFLFDEPVLGRTESLTVSLLPHAEFPRLSEITSAAYVAHPLAPKEKNAKIEVLNRLGLWI